MFRVLLDTSLSNTLQIKFETDYSFNKIWKKQLMAFKYISLLLSCENELYFLTQNEM